MSSKFKKPTHKNTMIKTFFLFCSFLYFSSSNFSCCDYLFQRNYETEEKTEINSCIVREQSPRHTPAQAYKNTQSSESSSAFSPTNMDYFETFFQASFLRLLSCYFCYPLSLCMSCSCGPCAASCCFSTPPLAELS